MTKMIKRFPSLFATDLFDRHYDFDSMVSDLFNNVLYGGPKLNVSGLKSSEDGWICSFSGFPRGDEFVDKDGNLTIEMALAGYSREQLKVLAEDGKLVISAEKKETDEPSRSLSRRSFRKEFSDPAHMWDLENTSASYEDGLLRVVVPPAQKKVIDAKLIDIK